MTPFSYPEAPHIRRHGPQGYKHYEAYRDWLRDEFLFRCVYCLKREQWGTVKGSYDIDHFLPQAIRPELQGDYDNLLYSCRSCNAAKREEIFPNPCYCLLRDRVVLSDDGSIQGTDMESRKLIRKLGLDDPEFREFRKLWIDIVALAQADPAAFHRIMKYPDNLPDLSKRRPRSNSRPDGIQQSCHARRLRGELPETY
jgi:hypothetical protein